MSVLWVCRTSNVVYSSFANVKLNQKISKLSEELNNHEDYNPIDFANITLEISKHQTEIEKLETLWLELEEIREKTI